MVDVDKVIKSAGWSIGYCKFQKKDGTVRNMWFQGRIHGKNLKGGPRKYNPKEHRLSWVRDVKLPIGSCVRSIKWDSIIKLTVNGQTYGPEQIGTDRSN